MEIRTIRKAFQSGSRRAKKLAGKKILLRVDFNVPMVGGQIKDDYKIVASLPTIRFLLRYRCKLIIVSHLASQSLKKDSKPSLWPIAGRLSELLGQEVKFVRQTVGIIAGSQVARLKEKEIILLENLRFYKEEEKNSFKFAKELAVLADIYVNDAFAVSHRRHASVSAVKKYLPSYAGLLLEKEVLALSKILKPEPPLLVIIGGAKISTKISLLKNLAKKSDRVLTGGAIANTFLAAHKLEVGKSLIDKGGLNYAKKIKNKNIIVPLDVIVSDRWDDKEKISLKSVDKLAKSDIIVDIGPKTIKLYARFIKKAQTIIWNGPMGIFEYERFKHGTLSIARLIASRSSGRAYGVAGGGETIEALKLTGMMDHLDWISSGGGATLAYLGGEKMPGLEKIVVH